MDNFLPLPPGEPLPMSEETTVRRLSTPAPRGTTITTFDIHVNTAFYPCPQGNHVSPSNCVISSHFLPLPPGEPRLRHRRGSLGCLSTPAPRGTTIGFGNL